MHLYALWLPADVSASNTVALPKCVCVHAEGV
jgi:hypothetical protein